MNPEPTILGIAAGDFWIALGTFLLALVAFFGEATWAWLRRPVLAVETGNHSPYSLGVPMHFTTSNGSRYSIRSYYCRSSITNTGKRPAENVEVFAEELRRTDRAKPEACTWLPMHLGWADIGQIDQKVFLPRIGGASMYRFCDIAHVLDPDRLARSHLPAVEIPNWCMTGDPRPVLSFDTVTKPNTKTYLVEPGAYELDVVVAAQNAKPVRHTIRIELTGWADDEADMLGKLLRVS